MQLGIHSNWEFQSPIWPIPSLSINILPKLNWSGSEPEPECGRMATQKPQSNVFQNFTINQCLHPFWQVWAILPRRMWKNIRIYIYTAARDISQEICICNCSQEQFIQGLNTYATNKFRLFCLINLCVKNTEILFLCKTNPPKHTLYQWCNASRQDPKWYTKAYAH